jgi:hypothetical protein
MHDMLFPPVALGTYLSSQRRLLGKVLVRDCGRNEKEKEIRMNASSDRYAGGQEQNADVIALQSIVVQ